MYLRRGKGAQWLVSFGGFSTNKKNPPFIGVSWPIWEWYLVVSQEHAGSNPVETVNIGTTLGSVTASKPVRVGSTPTVACHP